MSRLPFIHSESEYKHSKPTLKQIAKELKAINLWKERESNQRRLDNGNREMKISLLVE